ncbi:MAG: tripartite tricarboxylate transporter substrate binding protein [Ramlibacter sp.]|nr:tripartite tricarboxylate transporter substrate binding protein [Ramlibacter sp.]
MRTAPTLLRLIFWPMAGLLLGWCAPLAAQGWPVARPITLVVGYPAGGSVDLVARTIAQPLAQRLGTAVTVENIGGASGTLGAQKVVNAAPDGYTLLLGTGSEVSIARLFNSSIKYNGESDLSAIGMVGVTPMVWVTSPRTGLKSVDEALARARREPGKLRFNSSGVGTPLHVAGELINLTAGVNIRHQPTNGAANMVRDIVSDKVQFGVMTLSTALPHLEAGTLVPLGVTTLTRSMTAPGIPALAESARLKGYNMNVWFGLFGPARLPAPLVASLNRALNEVLRDQQVWQTLQKAGISNEGGAASALNAFVRAETRRVRAVIMQAVVVGPAS